jgi:hypothetical protein
MTRSRQTADWGSRAGLAKIVPSSVAVGSGTGSADSLGTVTFSGASSLSLNGVFSSTYDNYKVVCAITSVSTSTVGNIRLRVSGSDATSSIYERNGVYTVSNSSTINALTSTAQSSWVPFSWSTNSADGQGFVADFLNPFKTNYTNCYGLFTGSSTSTVWSGFLGLFTHRASTSYDGFTLYGDTGNITGTISVYGYTK